MTEQKKKSCGPKVSVRPSDVLWIIVEGLIIEQHRIPKWDGNCDHNDIKKYMGGGYWR